MAAPSRMRRDPAGSRSVPSPTATRHGFGPAASAAARHPRPVLHRVAAADRDHRHRVLGQPEILPHRLSQAGLRVEPGRESTPFGKNRLSRARKPSRTSSSSATRLLSRMPSTQGDSRAPSPTARRSRLGYRAKSGPAPRILQASSGARPHGEGRSPPSDRRVRVMQSRPWTKRRPQKADATETAGSDPTARASPRRMPSPTTSTPISANRRRIGPSDNRLATTSGPGHGGDPRGTVRAAAPRRRRGLEAGDRVDPGRWAVKSCCPRRKHAAGRPAVKMQLPAVNWRRPAIRSEPSTRLSPAKIVDQREAGFEVSALAGKPGVQHQGAVFGVDVGPGDAERTRPPLARRRCWTSDLPSLGADGYRGALPVARGIGRGRVGLFHLVDQPMDCRNSRSCTPGSRL